MNYEVTEVCPHCEREITLNWDIETDGYQIFCPECGKAVMLCSMCDRSPCDWAETGCKHSKDNYEAVNSDGWIPVEERLPEELTPVLVTAIQKVTKAGWEKGEEFFPVVDTDVYDPDVSSGWDCYKGKVIAWCPLPEPYRPETGLRTDWREKMMNTFLGGHK